MGCIAIGSRNDHARAASSAEAWSVPAALRRPPAIVREARRGRRRRNRRAPRFRRPGRLELGAQTHAKPGPYGPMWEPRPMSEPAETTNWESKPTLQSAAHQTGSHGPRCDGQLAAVMGRSTLRRPQKRESGCPHAASLATRRAPSAHRRRKSQQIRAIRRAGARPRRQTRRAPSAHLRDANVHPALTVPASDGLFRRPPRQCCTL